MLTAHNKLLVLFLGLVLVACSTEAPKISRLDSSGLTIVTLNDAVMLARPVRALAANARDYAYIGPVEINRMGQREYYFWVGLASTIDRDRIGLAPAEAVALVIIIDGEPTTLPLSDWQTALDLPPYDSSAPVYRTLAAPTSLDQIHRIGIAHSVEFHIISALKTAARYRLWHGDIATWSGFPDAEARL